VADRVERAGLKKEKGGREEGGEEGGCQPPLQHLV